MGINILKLENFDEIIKQIGFIGCVIMDYCNANKKPMHVDELLSRSVLKHYTKQELIQIIDNSQLFTKHVYLEIISYSPREDDRYL